MRRGTIMGKAKIPPPRSNVLYSCGISTDKIYELDLDTMLDISAGGVASSDDNPVGIGGVK